MNSDNKGKDNVREKAAVNRRAKTPAASNSKQNKNNKKKEGSVALSALKNFGIIFAACLVIFGLIASFAVALITSTVDDILKNEKDELESILNAQDGDAQTSAGGENYKIPAGESFTSLFVVTDFDDGYFTYYPEGDELDKIRDSASDKTMGVLGAGYKTVKARYIVLIRADKASREYTITPLASCTRVCTSSGYMLLSDVYAAFGAEYFTEKITALTGISPDYYFFMNITEAADFIKELGSFNVNLANDIYSDGASFGTSKGAYDAVTTALPPAEFIETEKADDKKDSEETTEAADDGDETEETKEKKERSEYDVAVRAGNVTVSDSNINALLMFENYENGIEERCDLEYQIAKGALARLAAMPESEMLSLFGKVCSYADYDEFGVELYDDGKINTNMDTAVFAKKTELIAAYLNFSINRLDFPGKFITNYFAPSLTEGTTFMLDYKLPPDKDKE